MNLAIIAASVTQTIEMPWNLYQWLGQRFTLPSWTVLIAVLLSIALPYLLGSINPAVLISHVFYRDDIRRHGSGNAGSTNMLRTYGKKAALATFLLDLGKAALAVVVGWLIMGSLGGSIAGFFVVFGHMFPIFAGFKGGKGVACMAMVILMNNWLVFLIIIGMFLIIALGTRIVSLASVMCAILYPLVLNAFVGQNDESMIIAMAILESVFVIVMHRSNMVRLWNGNESKLSMPWDKDRREAKRAAKEATDGEDKENKENKGDKA